MIPKADLDEYIDKNIGKDDAFGDEDVVLVRRIRRLLRVGLRRLNKVPPSDPVWQGTNYKPTLYKLEPYFSAILERDPEDGMARWILIASELNSCPNSFACELIEPLVLKDPKQVRWLVGAAEWVLVSSGFDTTQLLRESLSRLNSADSLLQDKLRSLDNDSNALIARAASMALAVLAGAVVNRCVKRY